MLLPVIGACVNGNFTDKISIFDRALHYGDGVFETIAVQNYSPQLWQLHIERLQYSCKQLYIPCPSLPLLKQESEQLIKLNQQGVLKIILTRGEGIRGYQLPEDTHTTRLLVYYYWPDYSFKNIEQGSRVTYCTIPLIIHPNLRGIKNLNCLPYILATEEWQSKGSDEGLMLDEMGYVIEGTRSNLFMVKDNCLFTPHLLTAGLFGAMRKTILDNANSLGITTYCCKLKPQDLAKADELFLCNSVFKIWPIKQLAKKQFSIGPITRQLQRYLINVL